MLSERQLQAALKRFDERMQALNEEYLRMMGEHIKSLGKLTASDVHRAVQMKRMNANVEAIKRRIARAMEANIRDVEQVFLAAAESDAKFKVEILKGFRVAYGDRDGRIEDSSAAPLAAIFGETHSPTIKGNKPLERILKAQLRLTGQSMENLSRTTILSEPYRKAVDVGVTAVQTGLTDYNSAVRRAMREAAGEGLRVKYPNSGLTRRLDTAVRQNILDGVRSINQDVLNQLGKEFGADGVEISAHALCAEDHLPYQGRQFSNKEFADLQNNLARQIGAWNCKHTVHPILLGISQPTYSDAELDAFRQNSREEIEIDGRTLTRYEWTQEQRRLETQVRYQKDIAVAAKASGDDVLRRETQAKINDLTRQYSRISDKADLIEQRERMAVSGFRKVKTALELKNPAKYGILQSGALNGFSKEADAHAKQYYAAVRKMKTDVNRIAQNTGWSVKSVQAIKDHIFNDLHEIDGEMRTFDPSYFMAESWQRLIQGKNGIREQDIVLLKHEYLEHILEKKGIPHEIAHEMAQNKHNYSKYIPKG